MSSQLICDSARKLNASLHPRMRFIIFSRAHFSIMPATCIITGYKIGVGTIIVYGFIISGTVFQNPKPIGNTNPDETTEHATTSVPVTTSDPGIFAECGTPPPELPQSNARSLEAPIARLLMSMITKRILGGTDTLEGDWPWMAYLFERRKRQKRFICGGTLINRQWIMTAAHCISQPNAPNLYGVTLGEHNSSKLSVHEKEMNVEAIVRHEEFATGTFNNDIALMKLAEAVVFTRYIRPVCLVPQGFPTDATESVVFEGEKLSFAGRPCTALGWGKTEKREMTEVMQQVNVIILPHLLCTSATRFPSSEPYNDRPVNENDPKFCAGGALGEDTCFGDSGGPLLCIYNGKYYLHGITSYGTDPCGQKNRPGIYTRTADYFEWIMKNSQ